MKSRMMMCVTLLGLQGFMIICGSKNIFGSSACDTVLYESVKAEDIYNLHVAGINLEEYGYIHVYQYVLVNTETLFVLGYTKSKKAVLSTLSLDSRRSTVIMEYPWTLAGFLEEATLTVFFLNDSQTPRAFVLIEYIDGNISRNTEETITYLEIFRADSVDNYSLLRRESIAETSIVFEINSNPEFKYRYLPGESLSEEAIPLKAATNDIAKLFLCDVNDDRYPDILVWKQRYSSRLIKDTGNADFVLEKETLSAMYFDPRSLTFSPLTPVNLGHLKNITELPFLTGP